MEGKVVPVPVTSEELPDGFSLRHKLYGHNNIIYQVAWSPNGRILASASADRSVRLWDVHYGRLLHDPIGQGDYVFSVAWSPDGRVLASGCYDETIRLTDGVTGLPVRDLTGHDGPVYNVAWSPDGRYLASASYDHTIRIWDSQNDWQCRVLEGHSDWVMSVAWSPDGLTLASGSRDESICFWDMNRGTMFRKLKGHNDIVNSVVWSPDGLMLASASDDQTIRLWDAGSGRLRTLLEGHTGLVLYACFSPDGSMLASKSRDNTVRLWRTGSWEQIATLKETMISDFNRGLAFHPHMPLLATLSSGERMIRIWNLDDAALLGMDASADTWHYRNAKVILVGDSGVGKSGLGLALTGRPWVKTGSTHGCRIWTFDSEDVTLSDGRQETRETLLWDLAGQPGYRQTNQLHLNEVSVALVVFDASNEERPLAGVQHWDRALRQAVRRQGDAALPLTKYLIAARVDRGGVPMWHSRLQNIVRTMNFDGYFETSAKEGWQIAELIEAVQAGIQWEALPRVSSNELFQTIRQFIIEEKKSGHMLSTVEDLYRLFCHTSPDLTAPDLRARFDTCLSRMENRALVRRLRFGNYVLLQPELLDAYASDLVDAAHNAPGGLGTVSEVDALDGRFISPGHSRQLDKEQQRLLLIATVEELVRHEIVLKEPTDAGTDLIFPSQFTREWPNLTELPGQTLRFTFEGPVLNIYAVLVIRLAHSQLYNKKEMYKNAATFTATVGGTCGIYLRELEEGQGEIILFFDDKASEATRYQFEDYVSVHLKRRALPGSIHRQRLYNCEKCGISITEAQVNARRRMGYTVMHCPVCEKPISLLDREERLTEPVPSAIAAIDRAADAQRDKASAELILKGKMTASDYDVLLCHNESDTEAVRALAEQLQERGILPWLPENGRALSEDDLANMKAVAVCVGRGKVPWNNPETVKYLQQFVSQAAGPFILVALPGCPSAKRFPEGVLNINWREQEPEGIDLLAAYIAAERKHDVSNR